MVDRLMLALIGLALLSPGVSARTPRSSSARSAVVRSACAEFEEDHAEARKQLVQKLFSLASWCNLKELFIERDRVYTQILAIDSENLEARKGLRYARNPDGTWKEPAPRELKNRNLKALADLPAKRAEAIAPYRDRLLELLDAEKQDPELREKVHAEILALDPDDERIREIRGEAKLDDNWVMAETAAGKQRRAEIKAAIQANVAASAKVEPIEATPREAELVDGWKHTVRSPGARVLGTIEPGEIEKIAQMCEAAGRTVTSVLGAEAKYPPEYTIYVLRPQERDGFVDKHTDIEPDNRASMKKMMGAGIYHTTNVFVADEDPAKRLDCAVRHTLSHLLKNAYRISYDQGWVWEGFGLYFTRELVGTRLTWFVLGSPGADDASLRGNLFSPTSNWPGEALKLFESATPPDLATVVQKDLFKLSVEDMLVSYALAAYLVEGRPKEVGDLLTRLGAGSAPEAAFQSALDLSVPEVQDRLTRWLKERR